jgi:(4S)-4-hydroxy-5-phosphonooxypentane-2,3-dione isomerase
MGFASRRRHCSVGAFFFYSSLLVPVIFWLLSLSQVTAFVPAVKMSKNVLLNGGAIATMSASSTTVTTALSAAANKPFAVIVKAKIDPNRIDEFLTLMETNAQASRQEPGCLRFDVLRSQDGDKNEFFFYELYQNATAVDFHKTQDHYNLWANFKASGGALESISYKTDGEFIS